MIETSVNQSPLLKWEKVSAYALTRSTRSLVANPRNTQECLDVMIHAKNHGLTICPRGQGYSYGDMILNDQQIIVNTSRMDSIIHWDPQTGILIAQAGVRLAEIFKLTLPTSWYLPSCPGGMNVTVAGAIANNIHGKDSWKNGNFGSCVLEIKFLTSAGDLLTVSSAVHGDIFKATIGGMGLLGIIQEVKLQLLRIPSAYVDEEVIPTENIAESMRIMEESQDKYDFIIAWVDAFAKGQAIGRGYVVRARWANDSTLVDPQRLKKSLTLSTKVFGIFPSKLTWTILRPLFMPWGICWLNRVMYFKAKISGRTMARKLFTEFNFMHNQIPDLNYVYHPQGFLEFQPVIPDSPECDAAWLEDILRLCQRHKAQSLLCAIKPHAQDDFMLSYQGNGYTIGIDIQLRGRRREDVQLFADELFAKVAQYEGKIYLAKDEMLTRNYFRQMYPQWRTFEQIKQRLDPQTLFSSELYRRLFSASG